MSRVFIIHCADEKKNAQPQVKNLGKRIRTANVQSRYHAGACTRVMQYLAKVYRIIARNTTMVFNIAKIAPLYRKVRAAVANGSTPKTDQMAAKLLEMWLGDKVYESGNVHVRGFERQRRNRN